jgi:predicted RND superfamily exporter protein
MKIKAAILFFMLIIIGGAAMLSSSLKFADDYATYGAIDPSERAKIKMFESNFESGSALSVIILENDSCWSTKAGIKRIENLTDTLNTRFIGTSFSSISNLEFPQRNGLTFSAKKLIDEDEDPLKLKSNYSDAYSKFISLNDKYALIFVHSDNLDLATRNFLSNWEKNNSDVHVSTFDQESLVTAIQEQSKSNLVVTTLVSLALVLISFYFFGGKINSILIILFFIIFNLAVLVILLWVSQIAISPHLSSLPLLTVILTFSDLMHILYHHDQLRPQMESDEISRKTLRRSLSFPLLMTSLTNIIGFVIYIAFTNNQYYVELSWLGIVIVLVAFLAAKYLAIELLGEKSVFFDRKIVDRMHQLHDHLFKKVIPARQVVLVGYCVLTFGLLTYLFLTVQLDADQYEVDPAQAEVLEAQSVLSENFFGNQSAAISVVFQSDNLLSDKLIRTSVEIESEIQQKFAPVYLASYLQVIRRYQRIQAGGHWKAFKLPQTISTEFRVAFDAWKNRLGWKEVVAGSGRQAKISFGFYSTDLNDRLTKYEALEEKLRTLSDDEITFELISISYAKDKEESGFVRIVLIGFGLVYLITFIVVLLRNRSLKLAFIFLMVNLFPFLFALMLMQWMSVPINSLSVFMCSILVGLCLDDSIYQLAMQKNWHVRKSIFPMVVTSIVLGFGALGFAFSSYSWLQPFSWIFLVAFFVSLLSDIFILPLLMETKETK